MKWLQTYKNSRDIIVINGYSMKVEDIIATSLITGTNLLLVSERGEGKTQILYDVLYGIFGGRGTYIRVTPDMDIKDIYTALDLEQLREMKGSTESIVKIVEQVKNPFTAIDELNRAPPIVQNQLLNVLDGYIEVKGKRYSLGIDVDGEREKYHVGIATINFGDHRYRGTFDIDSAILDRFGLYLDLDYYSIKTEDLEEILFQNEKLTEPKGNDRLKEILEYYRKFKETKEKLPFELIILIHYLREGIDYISAGPYSQRKTRGSIPQGAHEAGDVQGIMMPISIRTAKQIATLYRGFTFLAELYGYKTKEEYYWHNSLEILKLVLPYSGCLKTETVNSKYYDNPTLATEEIVKIIKEKFEKKKEDIIMAIKRKKEGKLNSSDLEKFEGEWSFIKDIISNI